MNILSLNVTKEGVFQIGTNDTNWEILSPDGEPVRAIEEHIAHDPYRNIEDEYLVQRWRCTINAAHQNICCYSVYGDGSVIYAKHFPLKPGHIILFDVRDGNASSVESAGACLLSHNEQCIMNKYGLAAIKRVNPNGAYACEPEQTEVLEWSTDGNIEDLQWPIEHPIAHEKIISKARWAIATVNLRREEQPVRILYSWYPLSSLEKSFQMHGVKPVA